MGEPETLRRVTMNLLEVDAGAQSPSLGLAPSCSLRVASGWLCPPSPAQAGTTLTVEAMGARGRGGGLR